MFGRIVPAAFCSLALALPTAATAVPILQWLDPYQVTFSAFIGGTGPYTSGANFGAAATANRETTNLGTATDIGASTAFMRAYVDARSGSFNDTNATQVVEFSRAFRLSGSANGWVINLSGFYNGFLGIQPLGTLNPKASVAVFGKVDSLDVPADPIHALETVTLDNSGRTTTTNEVLSAAVPDGNYEFAGSLAAGGSILHSLTTFGQAFSDFWSYPPSYGLSLTLNATPQPAGAPPPPRLIPPPPPPLELVENSGPTEIYFVTSEIPEIPEPSSATLFFAEVITFFFFATGRALPQRRPRGPLGRSAPGDLIVA
jgi:hypothetical protein